MPPGTVLIVDDDAVLRRSLARALRLAGFRTDVAEGGRDALARIAAGRPDVVVLDVSMPDLSGTEVCRRLRADGNEVPVVMLSALDEADDRISGLQAGADDYLVKPFVTAELELRLKALLRRRPPATGVLRVGDLVVDADTRTARRNGTELDLTRREFDLLEVLARNAGRGAQPRPAAGTGVGLRLRRRHQRRRHVRQLPAAQAGERRRDRG